MSGRIRTIKPDLNEDEAVANLSDAAWRVWISLWLVADDHGNVRIGERYIGSNVWQDTSRDAATPLAELVEKKFIEPYARSDQPYGHVRAWEKHQRIDNAGKAKVPPPEADDGSLPQWFREFRTILADSRESRGGNSELAEVSATTDGYPPRSPLARAGAHPSARPPARPPAQSGAQNGMEWEGRGGEAKSGAAAPSPPPAEQVEPRPSDPSPKAPTRRRGTRIDPDWTPTDETIARFRTKERVDPIACLEMFRNHFLAKTGEKGVKLDWEATFRNWVLEDIRRGTATPWAPPRPEARTPLPAPEAPTTEQAAQIAEQSLELEKTLAALSESTKPRYLVSDAGTNPTARLAGERP